LYLCFYTLLGPTSPNRFFLYGASASGVNDSPTGTWHGENSEWEMVPFDGLAYKNGSFFDLLGEQRKRKIGYHVFTGQGMSQVALIKNQPPEPAYENEPPPSTKTITFPRYFNSINYLEAYLKGDASRLRYWVGGTHNHLEPSYYGAGTLGLKEFKMNFADGESQHPLGWIQKGEALIKRVYEALRASKIWNESALIITYDEHGGFFDHVPPPRAVPPGDGVGRHAPFGTKDTTRPEVHFNFGRYGVRVPAVVVSPWIPRGVVDHTIYDHTSILRTSGLRLGLRTLTGRDKFANPFAHLFSLKTPRTDRPPIPDPQDPEGILDGANVGKAPDAPRSGLISRTDASFVVGGARAAAALDPSRADEIRRRVENMKTQDDAASLHDDHIRPVMDAAKPDVPDEDKIAVADAPSDPDAPQIA
jgi:phospholipase C